jgi:microcystin degradation protein MlrC
MTWRIVTGSISHETNSFSPISTGVRLFTERAYAVGEDIIRQARGTKTSIGGFLDWADECGAEIIPTVNASATPSGIVEREAYDLFKGKLLDGIKENMPKVDGVLLALHGAMVVDGIPDAEGDLLQSVRAIIGPAVPLVSTLDFHASLTDLMVDSADGLFGYNTYPHVDSWERAIEAGRFMARLLRNEIKPVSVVVRPPIAPAVVTARTGWGPIKDLMEMAFRYETEPGVLNVSVYGGFVYSDIHDAGLAFLATTDHDLALAERIANDLAKAAWDMRERFVANMMSPDAAVVHAMQAAKGPVVLADVADNTGAGASGDGTEILRALLKHDAREAVVITIPGKDAVAEAFRVGVGGTFDFEVGGKFDDKHGAPVRLKGLVRVLSDGVFVNRGPMSTGARGTMGRTAVVQAFRVGEGNEAAVHDASGVEVILNEYRFQPVDPEAARSVGIDPARRKIVVVKSSVHYRASYEPIAAEIIEVDGPGLASPNLDRF